MQPHLSRRDLLRALGMAPFAALAAACAGNSSSPEPGSSSGSEASPPAEEQPAAPTSTPEPPFVLPAGESKLPLMAGTAYETPLYVFGSGRPGRIALVLGGVHGNEPGGWLAADWMVYNLRPENGAVLLIPRANRIAINLFERTTDAIGDLNRSYPGFADGLPMERMAAEIVSAIREYHVDLVHDMHESWAFYKDRTTNGTAFLGETISTNGDAAAALVNSVIDRVNPTVQNSYEAFSFRDFGGQNPAGQPPSPQAGDNLPRQTNTPPGGRGTSSLGLNRYFPGLTPILVEMGQQQAIERRIALHIQVLQEILRGTGIGVA